MVSNLIGSYDSTGKINLYYSNRRYQGNEDNGSVLCNLNGPIGMDAVSAEAALDHSPTAVGQIPHDKRQEIGPVEIAMAGVFGDQPDFFQLYSVDQYSTIWGMLPGQNFKKIADGKTSGIVSSRIPSAMAAQSGYLGIFCLGHKGNLIEYFYRPGWRFYKPKEPWILMDHGFPENNFTIGFDPSAIRSVDRFASAVESRTTDYIGVFVTAADVTQKPWKYCLYECARGFHPDRGDWYSHPIPWDNPGQQWASPPSAVAMLNGDICVFILGPHGNLFECHFSGDDGWQWIVHGIAPCLAGLSEFSAVGVIPVAIATPNSEVYVFILGPSPDNYLSVLHIDLSGKSRWIIPKFELDKQMIHGRTHSVTMKTISSDEVVSFFVRDSRNSSYAVGISTGKQHGYFVNNPQWFPIKLNSAPFIPT